MFLASWSHQTLGSPRDPQSADGFGYENADKHLVEQLECAQLFVLPFGQSRGSVLSSGFLVAEPRVYRNDVLLRLTALTRQSGLGSCLAHAEKSEGLAHKARCVLQ